MSERPEKRDFHNRANQTVPIRLGLLGTVSLTLGDGREIEISSKKNRALLAFLALAPGHQATRERLCGLLWSDRGEEQARGSLRQSLAVLRKELGEADTLVLNTHDDVVALRPAALSIDAVEIAQLAATNDVESLRRGAALWRGELLADTTIKDQGFEDWVSAERRRLVTVAIALFEKLCAVEEGQAAIDAARRLVEFDPLREASQRALIRALAAAGETALALQQYETCRALLKAEFGVEPTNETVALRTEIAKGTIGPAKATPKMTVAKGGNAPVPSESKPAIAVLPFANLSGDLGRQYLADAIAEDIGTELSRFRSLRVIASNSAFRFRDASLSLGDVGDALAVTHVVRGSVRQAGGRLRLSAQLGDVATGTTIWAEHFDGEDLELPTFQDRIVAEIAAIVEGRIAAEGAEQTRRRPIASWTAYDYYLKGRDFCLRYRDQDALPFLEKATELDRDNASAFAWMAIAYVGNWFFDRDRKTLDLACSAGKRALEIDDREVRCHHAMAWVSMWQRQFGLAAHHWEIALRLNPADVLSKYDKASWLSHTGRHAESLSLLDSVRDRDPFPPAYAIEQRGNALLLLGRFDEALAEYNKSSDNVYWLHAFRAATYAQLGRMAEATAEVSRLLALKPDVRSADIVEFYELPEHCKNWLDGLRKAGLP